MGIVLRTFCSPSPSLFSPAVTVAAVGPKDVAELWGYPIHSGDIIFLLGILNLPARRTFVPGDATRTAVYHRLQAQLDNWRLVRRLHRSVCDFIERDAARQSDATASLDYASELSLWATAINPGSGAVIVERSRFWPVDGALIAFARRARRQVDFVTQKSASRAAVSWTKYILS
jgi:hypothetical protein